MKKLLVCTNYRANPNHPSCAARGSKIIYANLMQQLQQNNGSIEVEETQCLGFCSVGCNARLMPNGQFFHELAPENLSEIIDAAKKFIAQKT